MRMLVVDDEELRVEPLLRMLRAAAPRIDVDYVSSSHEVLDTMHEVARDGGPYAVLVIDHNMDGPSGKQILQAVSGRLDTLSRGFDLETLTDLADIADPALSECVRGSFADVEEYRTFCRRHASLVKILYSSERFGDGVDDLPDDVVFIHKVARSEIVIGEVLVDAGVLTAAEWRRVRRWRR